MFTMAGEEMLVLHLQATPVFCFKVPTLSVYSNITFEIEQLLCFLDKTSMFKLIQKSTRFIISQTLLFHV